MSKLTRDDLMSLEKYSEVRDEFRRNIMAHKKNRIVGLGPHMTLHFEDRTVMHYQIQEMLRAEKIFDSEGIQEELDAYNPLIPDGTNFKATCMIEYEDPAERSEALKKMLGIEDKIWVKVDGYDKVNPIADEDLERATEDKTSSVHFLRFELSQDMIDAAKQGAAISIGVDHPAYDYSVDALNESVRNSLVSDLV